MTATYRDLAQRRPMYVGTRAHVLCIEGTTGETLWQVELPHASTFNQGLVTLLLHRQRLFAAAAKAVALLRPDDGAVVWATEVKKLAPPMVLALDEGVPGGLLVAAGAGLVFGLDATSGTLVWQNDLPGLGYLPLTVRAPHAIVAQPRTYYVQAGKARVVSQIENDQIEPIGPAGRGTDIDS